jgi:replicative DNA helicase
MSIERVILSNLLHNDEYARKVIPFLKTEYFQDYSERVVFDLVDDYVKKYNEFPSLTAIAIELTEKEGLNDQAFESTKNILSSLEKTEVKLDWLIDNTEKWCQDKALYLGIMKSISIMDDKSGSLTKGAIPQILSDALAVSFDNHIGHNFIDDAETRFDFYHRKESRVKFDIDYFNKITKNGFPKKTLNVYLAGTGVGKSLVMCHNAASNLLDGLNVLYITMEMAEEEIAKRIDCNLLDIPISEIDLIPKEMYLNKMNRLRKKAIGKLIIKEYPTASVGSTHFRHLINELKLKKNFQPDIVYIDYLNICVSSRLKGGNHNSYTVVKAIAEELRGLAVEFEVPIVSATQTTRSGYSNSDVGLTDTSESFGLPATADFMAAIITSDELQDLNQLMIKQLKNRYSDPSVNKRFVIGVDRAKMRLYNVEQSAQQDLTDGPVMDNTTFGQEEMYRTGNGKKLFDGFK